MAADPLAVTNGRIGAGSPGRFFTWVTAELAPFPGRGIATLRMVIACLAVVTLSMALELPEGALSAFLVFWCSKEDVVTTTKAGILVIVAITIGFGISILAFLFTLDHPAYRLVLMSAFFCAGMYFSRVFAVGPLAWAVAFILLITQQWSDLYPQPETLIRFNLWTWVALALPAAVVMLANVAILPSRPNVLLRQEAKRRLAFVIEALDRRLEGLVLDATTPFDVKVVGAARLLGLLKLSAGSSAALKEKLPSYTAMINTLNRMVETACMLGALPPAVDPFQLHRRIARLRSACDDLRIALDADLRTFRIPSELERVATDDVGPVGPILEEMERHLSRLAGDIEQLSAPPSGAPAASLPSAHPRLFVSDALSNPLYLQFAVKVTCAAMLCYVAYTAFDWFGIHTCVITCAVVAMDSAGATIHKAALRLTGALIGGGLAILATVYVIPHLDSIGELLLLIVPVAALSAWITSGSERIAYCGLQIALAFFLCVLHAFGPSSDVTFVRDRLVGIVLGIVVMTVMFNYVWPERAGQQMLAALVKAIRSSASLLRRHGRPASAAGVSSIEDEHDVIFENLVTAQRMAEVAYFEPSPPGAPQWLGDDAALVAATQATSVSALYVAQLREEGTPEPDDPGTPVLKAFDNAVTLVLLRIAERLEADTPATELLTGAEWSRLRAFEDRQFARLKAIETGKPDGVADAFRELIGRVRWLAGAQT